MYVVRRSFRNYGQMVVPGSVVEPGTIKRFKSRLNDGNIVEVTEQNFDKWDTYFRQRIGVSINVKPDEQKPDEQKPDEQKPDEQKPDEQKPAEQKPAEQKPAEQKPAQAQAKVVVKPASK